MPETGIDIAPKAYEVIHNPPFAVIANLTARDPQEALEVAHQMKDGIPPLWHKYDTIEHLILDPETPYFVKYRRLPAKRFQSRLNREFYTVMNEMSLSPKIRKFLESPAGIKIANSYDFSEVYYVEPLAAIINEKSRVKALVYERIKGTSPDLDHPLETRLRNLANELKTGLGKRGVAAYDLNFWQFIIPADEADRRIYLVDAQEFSSMKPT